MKSTGTYLLSILAVVTFFLNSAAFWKIQDNRALFQNFLLNDFLFFTTAFLIIGTSITSSIYFLRDLEPTFQLFTRKNMTALLIALLVATGFHFALKPKFKMYYDEDLYLQEAHHITKTFHTKRPMVVDQTDGKYQAIQFGFNKFPKGYTSLLALISFNSNDIKKNMFWLNFFLFFLTGLLILKLGKSLFRPGIGWISMLLFFAIPQNWFWYKSGTVEPSAAFFSLLSIFFALKLIRPSKEKMLEGFCLLFASATAITFRPESLIIMLPVIACCLIYFFRNRGRVIEISLFSVFWILLSSPHLWHMICVKNLHWGNVGGSKFSIYHATINFPQNMKYLFSLSPENGPMSLITILALLSLGLVLLSHIRRKFQNDWDLNPIDFGMISTWFFSVFIIFILFYAGGLESGMNKRYSLLFHIPLVILAGSGLYIIWQMVKNRFQMHELKWIPLGVIFFLLVISPSMIQAKKNHISPQMNVLDFENSKIIRNFLPYRSALYTYTPSLYSPYGISVIEADLMISQSNQVPLMAARFPGGLYFYEGYWCHDPASEAFPSCQRLKRLAPLELIKSFPGAKNFKLYRLKTR